MNIKQALITDHEDTMEAFARADTNPLALLEKMLPLAAILLSTVIVLMAERKLMFLILCFVYIGFNVSTSKLISKTNPTLSPYFELVKLAINLIGVGIVPLLFETAPPFWSLHFMYLFRINLIYKNNTLKLLLSVLFGISGGIGCYLVMTPTFGCLFPFCAIISVGFCGNTATEFLHKNLRTSSKKLNESRQLHAQKDAKIEFLINAIPLSLAHIDQSLHYKYVNRSYAEYVEKDAESIIGSPLIDILGEKSFTSVSHHIDQVLTGTEQTFEAQLEIPNKQPRYALVTYTPEVNKDNEVIGFFVTLADISDRRQTELQLKETQSQLVQSEKLASLGEMSAGVAHELNNPLSLVMGFNNRIKHSLSRAFPDAYQSIESHIENVDKGATRMKKIIQHMRTFSRVSSAPFEKIDLNEMIVSSFTLWEEQLRLSNIETNFELDNLKPIIMGDFTRLEQVIVNLISNSKDALLDNPQQIKKSISVETKVNDEFVEIRFSDRGIGISDDKINYIFDPFYTTKKAGKGTGLGLSVSLDIIKEHFGKITCRSSVKEGTQFILTFALVQSNSKPLKKVDRMN
ncbi:MAG: PAS domain S-box-containing protein [Candidatus Marinamargulisbacteria bacterium]|jgi:PAS domain S-box-containing protein